MLPFHETRARRKHGSQSCTRGPSWPGKVLPLRRRTPEAARDLYGLSVIRIAGSTTKKSPRPAASGNGNPKRKTGEECRVVRIGQRSLYRRSSRHARRINAVSALRVKPCVTIGRRFARENHALAVDTMRCRILAPGGRSPGAVAPTRAERACGQTAARTRDDALHRVGASSARRSDQAIEIGVGHAKCFWIAASIPTRRSICRWPMPRWRKSSHELAEAVFAGLRSLGAIVLSRSAADRGASERRSRPCVAKTLPRSRRLIGNRFLERRRIVWPRLTRTARPRRAT